MNGTARMKAVVQDRYGGPEHLRLTDLPVPEPRADEIRLRASRAPYRAGSTRS